MHGRHIVPHEHVHHPTTCQQQITSAKHVTDVAGGITPTIVEVHPKAHVQPVLAALTCNTEQDVLAPARVIVLIAVNAAVARHSVAAQGVTY